MLPVWLRQVDRALRELSQRVTLLGAATPSNAREERARLREFAGRGSHAMPSWRYAPHVGHVERRVAPRWPGVRRRLDALLVELRALHDFSLAMLYETRVRELLLEARICECVGTKDASPLAARRFGPFGPTTAAAADLLADAWINEHPLAPLLGEAERDPREVDTVIATDDPHPHSLLSLLRAEVGRRRIPFAVVVHPHLSALAATGNQTILVAAGRRITGEATRRTVLHEIEGHVLPRVRAARAPLGILSIGTARSADEQEGYALLLEERHGFSTPVRRRELAGRYLAVRAMRQGANFVEVVRRLTGDYGVPTRDAVVMAERAFRGSDGTFPGLGRERVYLESYVRVRALLADAPDDEAVLASGQVSLDAIDALRPYVASG